MTTIDTGTDDLLAEITDGVAVLTMNRPARRNALSNPMLQAMGEVLAAVEIDPAVRCVVLTGAGGAFCAGGDVKAMAASRPADGDGGGDGDGGDGGGGAFCAGGDVKAMAASRPADGDGDGGVSGPHSVDEAIHRQRLSQRATSGRLWHMPKPTIAAITGPAAGAGLSLALACDLRYAAAGVTLTTAFARVAFAGDYGGTWFLTRLVGPARAKELYYFSERLTSEEAQRLGLVNGVFPAEELEGEVMDRARRLAAGPAVAYRYMKENLNRAIGGELGECMDLEVTHHVHTGLTRDHREAAQAFVDKREPRFEGR